jgi:hypothetical protein
MINKFRQAYRRSKISPEIISAVHDDDLISFLTSIGSINDINSGKIKCKFCKEIINLENIQAVIPDSGSISYICNNPTCIRNLISFMKDNDV